MSLESILLDQQTEIAKTIAAEAAGEGRIGMHAVTNTIGNRSASRKKPPIDIISQKNQYYGYTAKNRDKLYEQVKDIADDLAKKLLSGELEDITGGAEYFLQDDEPVRSWHGKKTIKIGNHTFYTEAGR